MTGRARLIYLLLLLALLLTGVLSLWIGTANVGLGHYWSNARQTGTPVASLWSELSRLALPRLLLAMLAGAALACAGAMFQALFRNPLASPYTLGVSSGASLGAAIAITFLGSAATWYGWSPVSFFAFLGALACVLTVYAVAGAGRGASSATLLLAGITIGFICSAGIVLVLYLGSNYDVNDVLRWTMGRLQTVGLRRVYEMIALLAAAAVVVIYLHRDLDLLMMGEDIAAGRGVSVRRSRALIYFTGSLLTAAVVAHCGPIGFVGLIVPHMMRFAVGPVHRRLLPACALAGAMFLPLCDLLARNAMWWFQGESRELPVGVLTNMLGGGFFLYLLLSKRGQRGGL